MVPDPQHEPMCPVHPCSGGIGGPGPQGLLPDRVTRQRFSPQSVPDGGNASEPVLCTTTTDRWSDPRVSHRVCEPWFGETWFFEKGCTSRAPPYPVELMTAGPDEESKGELADAAASILMKILYGARMGRWGLLKAVTSLATYLTKWTTSCDRAFSGSCAT